MKVIAICQYQENYAFNDDGTIDTKNPHFKNKGSMEFIVDLGMCNIDADCFINGMGEIKDMITEIILDKNNDYCKYEVISIEPQFTEPGDLTEKFKAKLYAIN